jgi:hypothetical protein
MRRFLHFATGHLLYMAVVGGWMSLPLILVLALQGASTRGSGWRRASW